MQKPKKRIQQLRQSRPMVFHLTKGDAKRTKRTRFGSVGMLFHGDGIEAVSVSKENEEIDPKWFSQKKVDLITVLQGRLCFEFEREDLASQILGAGDMLVLPAEVRCRAYRWPRSAKRPTLFLAVYPV